MSGNYTLAISRKQYDDEMERYMSLSKPGFRDECTNLCDIGDSRGDCAKLVSSFEDEQITDDFIEKMERLFVAVGTLEKEEIEYALKWFRFNKNKNFTMVYE